jgi:hypothetical protein
MMSELATITMRFLHSVLLVCLFAANVRGDASSDLFREGVTLLEHGDAIGACAKFGKALEARPGAPGVLLNLGLCNLRQNKLATALKWFREAQLRAAERGQTETEIAAKQQTMKLAPIVPIIKLVPSAPIPNGALVLLDGGSVDRTALARVEVDPGSHTLAVSGPGLERTEQTIDVPAQTPEPMPVTLTVRTATTITPVAPVVPARRTDNHERPRHRHRLLAVGLAATGVAAAGVGGFFLRDARYLGDQRDNLLATCSLDRPCSGQDLDDYDRRGSRANTIATVGFIAGGTVLAASIVVFLLDGRGSNVAIAPTHDGAFVSSAIRW